MANGRFVSYLRVSTDAQGRSGLGLEAQRQAVETYLNGGDWALVDEVVEIESGKRRDRPELARALALCRAHRATLVVAKMDRLARDAAFLLSLRDGDVEFVACDMPGACRMTIGILAVVAEHERDMISNRTKAALAAAKVRGVKLGGFRGRPGTAEDCAKARAARQAAVDERALALAPIVAEIDPNGAASLRAVAAKLTERGVPTPSGRGAWTPASVARLRQQIARARLFD